MSVAKVIEISAESKESFEAAMRKGLRKASETVQNIRGAWIKEQKVEVKDGEVTRYRVNMAVTFEID